MSAPIEVLGIETSCDESSAAIVSYEAGRVQLLAHALHSQVEAHRPFGGVVPEIACRSHVEVLTHVVEECLDRADRTGQDLSGVAVAHRPGLIGALLVGVTTAKSLAWAWDVPLVGVHHLEAHLEVTRLFANDEPSNDAVTSDRANAPIDPPYLGVVLSGGHTDLYVVEEGRRELLGQTLDDAIGEAFDKVASVLDLPYPGGPSIARLAERGDASAIRLPRTLLDRDSLDFSFSGIKTSVLYKYRGQNAASDTPLPNAPRVEDLCASFQEAVVAVVVEKVRRALVRTGLRQVIFGGGVTANRRLREEARRHLLEARRPVADRLLFPPIELATDNGVMIAALGAGRIARGERDGLELEASPS